MKNIFAILLSCASMLPCFAQQGNYAVKGRVYSNKNEPLLNASVFLLSVKDSSLVKSAIADQDGNYAFENLSGIDYLISASYVGFKKQVLPTKASIIGTVVNFTLLQVETLKEVTISAQKPMIQQQLDKLIFNVNDNSATAGNNALEVLAKAPGVTVDQSGAVSISGRSGVLIMIDGKRSYLSQEDLSAYLRGLPASTLDRIELISNPSSRYDAEGTSGIIDIRLKRDPRMGINGSVSLAYLQGTHPSGNGSVNVNLRKKNLNIFASASSVYNKVEGRQMSYRSFFNDAALQTGSVVSENFRNISATSYNLRLGADYNAGKNTTLGLVLLSASSDLTLDYKTRIDNSFINSPLNYYITSSLTKPTRKNATINFNLRHLLDSTGKELNFDLDFAPYSSRDKSNLQTSYYNPDGSAYAPYYNLLGNLKGKLDVYAARLDYNVPKFGKGSFETGIRGSMVRSDNELLFYDNSTGAQIIDFTRSNRFKLTEHIYAAYASYRLSLGKLQVQGGVRVEHTNTNGKQIATAQTIERSYTQFFPSMALSYELRPNYSIGGSVSRRISRPSYGFLNPFRFYGEPNSLTEGNPSLLPELTYVYELTQTLYKRFILRLNYSDSKDPVRMVFGVDANNPRISTQKPVNLDRLQTYSFIVSAPISLGSWFSSFNNITAAYSKFEGNAFSTELNRSSPWMLITSNNTIRYFNGWAIDIIGAYRSGLLIDGFQYRRAFSTISGGVSKQLFSKRATVRLNVSDIFRQNVSRGTTTLKNYSLLVNQWDETRRFTVGLTSSFGGTQVAAARNRTSVSDEERSRANQ